ncbi:MAG: hypothetical protein K9I85_14285 [Saprospiraceae bacterium]|nr:hypothetical protein [Saprospiraceae bacterium]
MLLIYKGIRQELKRAFFFSWKYVGLVALVLSLCSSCTKTEYPFYSGQGKRPVYVDYVTLEVIQNEPPQPVLQGGTIILKDTLLFQLDYGQGIHVFDVSDPANALTLTFIRIPAISSFTIDGHFLYADNWRDLVTLDIQDLFQIVVLARQKDVFEPLLFPPQYSGIFECVDLDKGAVVGWLDVDLTNVRCRTEQ